MSRHHFYTNSVVYNSILQVHIYVKGAEKWVHLRLKKRGKQVFCWVASSSFWLHINVSFPGMPLILPSAVWAHSIFNQMIVSTLKLVDIIGSYTDLLRISHVKLSFFWVLWSLVRDFGKVFQIFYCSREISNYIAEELDKLLPVLTPLPKEELVLVWGTNIIY